MTRTEAILLGLPRYNTGKLCGKGHASERYVATRCCVECHKAHAVNRPNVLKAATVRRWRHANPEHIRKYQAAWMAANTASRKLTYSAYRKNNRQKVNATNSRRRARQMGQLCVCCTSKDIEALYLVCPEGSEVDHRVALALGGRHCLNNLQILTEAQHLKKTAKDIRACAALRKAA